MTKNLPFEAHNCYEEIIVCVRYSSDINDYKDIVDISKSENHDIAKKCKEGFKSLYKRFDPECQIIFDNNFEVHVSSKKIKMKLKKSAGRFIQVFEYAEKK